MIEKSERARDIQEAIREILFQHWDPIGVNREPNVADEYDAYVGRIYRSLTSECTSQEIEDLLVTIERDEMGLTHEGHVDRRDVTHRLLSLDVRLDQ